MSGVRTGSRLEQLQQLRARLDHEIAQERRRLALTTTLRPIPVEPVRVTRTRARRPDSEPRRDPAVVRATLDKLGATPADVRAWARHQGVRVGEQGRLAAVLLEAYIDAHQEGDTA